MNIHIIVLDNHDFLVLFFVISMIIYFIKYFLFGKKQKRKYWIYPVFVFYLLALVDYAMLPIFIYGKKELVEIYGSSSGQSVSVYLQLIPFKTLFGYLGEWNFYQIIGNIIILMPVPFFIYLFRENSSMKKMAFCSIMAAFGIEFIQLCIDLFTGYANRICDIDDFILNSVGAVLAAGIICILRKKICFQKLYYIFVYRKKDMDSFGAVRG